jgi:hypothetical protein
VLLELLYQSACGPQKYGMQKRDPMVTYPQGCDLRSIVVQLGLYLFSQ